MGGGLPAEGAEGTTADRSVSEIPHLPQKAKPGGFAKPHRGQEGVSEVPHLPQKLIPSGFSNPQLPQRIGLLYSLGPRSGKRRKQGYSPCFEREPFGTWTAMQ